MEIYREYEFEVNDINRIQKGSLFLIFRTAIN